MRGSPLSLLLESRVCISLFSARSCPSLLLPPQVSELVQFLLVKDQKKIPIKRKGTFRGAHLGVFGPPKASLAAGSSELQAPSAIPCPFLADMKSLIGESKGPYTEIVNKAGRTLQEVGRGIGRVLGTDFPPSTHTPWINPCPPAGVWAAVGGDRQQTPHLHPHQ